jgi:carbon-monoxide dehydrogenase medium subunit
MALATYELAGGTMRNVRIGLGGIEEKPRRIAAAEAALEGQQPGEQVFAAAADAAIADVDAMEDASTSQEYRRDLAGVAIRRALKAGMAAETAAK